MIMRVREERDQLGRNLIHLKIKLMGFVDGSDNGV